MTKQMKTAIAVIITLLSSCYGAAYTFNNGSSSTASGVETISGATFRSSTNAGQAFSSGGGISAGPGIVSIGIFSQDNLEGMSAEDIIASFTQFSSSSFSAGVPTGYRSIFSQSAVRTVTGTVFSGKNVYLFVGNGNTLEGSDQFLIIKSNHLFTDADDLTPTTNIRSITTNNSTVLLGEVVSNVQTTNTDASITPGWRMSSLNLSLYQTTPRVNTIAPGDITENSVTLRGTLDLAGQTTTVQFEYGLTSDYGNTVNATLDPNNMTSQLITLNLTGLDLATTYHYRLKASYSGGVVVGENMSFTTYLPVPYTFTITNGVVTITGYSGADDSLIIPESINGLPVKAINSSAFAYSGIKSITIPSGVNTIGVNAFFGCANLENVTIPAAVTSIGSGAFASCPKLKWANFLGNSPTMGGNVFLSAGSGFSVYYIEGKTGFTTPAWINYPAFPIENIAFISPPAPSYGILGNPYQHTIEAVGIPTPVFFVKSGSLPTGITLSSNGLISGTPTVAGIFSGIIAASNGISPVAEQSFTIDTRVFSLVVTGENGTVTGAGYYLPSSAVNLAAYPAPGYIFSNWSGDVVDTTNPVVVEMNVSKVITATFSPDNSDSDNDGLTNYREIVQLGTNPNMQDTDGDGVDDRNDQLPLNSAETLDSDGDGIGDNVETDDDNDGLSDTDELNIHYTNPKRADSDGDGLSDQTEIFVHLTNPLVADTDKDGLIDGLEVNTHKTNPIVADSDGDGFLDGYEVSTGKSPLNDQDKPALVAEARTAIEFTFSSAIGKTYRIEDSPDLENWTTVESGILGNGEVIQRFYSTRNLPKRYFRVEEAVE